MAFAKNEIIAKKEKLLMRVRCRSSLAKTIIIAFLPISIKAKMECFDIDHNQNKRNILHTVVVSYQKREKKFLFATVQKFVMIRAPTAIIVNVRKLTIIFFGQWGERVKGGRGPLFCSSLMGVEGMLSFDTSLFNINRC